MDRVLLESNGYNEGVDERLWKMALWLNKWANEKTEGWSTRR